MLCSVGRSNFCMLENISMHSNEINNMFSTICFTIFSTNASQFKKRNKLLISPPIFILSLSVSKEIIININQKKS